MIGPVVSNTNEKRTVTSSDIIKNFHSHSSMKHIDLSEALSRLKDLSSFDRLSKIFVDVNNYHDQEYPDIFKKLYQSLSKVPQENEITLRLLLVITCEASLVEKMQELKILLCKSDQALNQNDPEMFDRQRAFEIFEKLFILSSVQLLREVEHSGYKMTINETYSVDEQEKIGESAKEAAKFFVDHIFKSQ